MTDQVGQQRSGITRSMPTAAASKSIFSRTVTVTLIRSGIVLGFFLAWEFASGRWIEPFLISSPSRIFTSLFTGFYSGDLLQHTWVTFLEIAIGYPIGAIAGIGLGYSFGRSRLLAEIFEPIIIALKVIFPAISPYVFTGIRTSIPFAVIGAIVGEFVAATEGVGFFIRMSAGIFKTADVFVGIIVLMIRSE